MQDFEKLYTVVHLYEYSVSYTTQRQRGMLENVALVWQNAHMY